MFRFTCHNCHRPIPNGLAHIRSVRFVQVAFCGLCLDLGGDVLEGDPAVDSTWLDLLMAGYGAKVSA